MNQTILVKKASGEEEPFSQVKLENSLKRVGADDESISTITDEIKNWLHKGVSTKKIYKQAFKLLKRHEKGIAARYKLKKAIMELGPTGYPFEHFVGQLIRNYGFEIQIGQTLPGKCVQHEVDVVATGNNKQIFVECKFYNSQGKQANVKVPLYIRARVDDLIRKRELLPEFSKISFQGWVVTNTRFTSDALEYGKCAGLHLVSWNYPKGHSLKDMIEKEGYFPITVLTSLNQNQKQLLLDEGTVLCRQIYESPEILNQLDINTAKKNALLEEISNLCQPV